MMAMCPCRTIKYKISRSSVITETEDACMATTAMTNWTAQT